MQVFGIQPQPHGGQRPSERVRSVSSVRLDARPLGTPTRRQIGRWLAAVERDRDLKRAGRVVIAPMYALTLLTIDRAVAAVACDALTDRLAKFIDAHSWRGATNAEFTAWLNAGFADLVMRGFLSRIDGGYALTWPHDHLLWTWKCEGARKVRVSRCLLFDSHKFRDESVSSESGCI